MDNELDQFGYVSLMFEEGEEGQLMLSCYCNCGCACYVTR